MTNLNLNLELKNKIEDKLQQIIEVVGERKISQLSRVLDRLKKEYELLQETLEEVKSWEPVLYHHRYGDWERESGDALYYEIKGYTCQLDKFTKKASHVQMASAPSEVSHNGFAVADLLYTVFGIESSKEVIDATSDKIDFENVSRF